MQAVGACELPGKVMSSWVRDMTGVGREGPFCTEDKGASSTGGTGLLAVGGGGGAGRVVGVGRNCAENEGTAWPGPDQDPLEHGEGRGTAVWPRSPLGLLEGPG